MKATRGPLTRIRAAIDGWVRSFSLRDADLYSVPGDSVTGVAVTAKSVMQLDAVWSCVRLISETIATLPLSMHERTAKGKQLASAHPLHFIIHDQPNADSTASVFWEAMVAAMLLRGAGRAEKLMIGGRLVALAFLNPDKLVIGRDTNGRKVYRYPRPNGEMREIPPSSVWTIPGFTLDGENGVSVVAYGAKVFGTAIASEQVRQRRSKAACCRPSITRWTHFLSRISARSSKRTWPARLNAAKPPCWREERQPHRWV